VVESSLSTYVSTSASSVVVELSGDENKTGINFVDERFGSISGSVTSDTTGDGVGDTALPGVTITIYDSNGKVVGLTLTDSAGNYGFIGVPNGVYTVVQTNLPGYVDVSDTEGNPLDSTIKITIVSGAISDGQNFVDKLPTASPTPAPTLSPTSSPTNPPTNSPTLAQLGCIIGNVQEDTNNDNIGDKRLQGVTITVTSSSGKVLTRKTNANGRYKFCKLPADSYTVFETNLPGYTDVKDVDGNPLDSTITVNLPPGKRLVGRNFVDEKISSAPTNPPTVYPTKAPTNMAPVWPTPTKAPTKSPTMAPTWPQRV
jgi:hypothetical protein